MEHATPEALKDYLEEHPGADKANHTVKKKKAPSVRVKERTQGAQVLIKDLKDIKHPRVKDELKSVFRSLETVLGKSDTGDLGWDQNQTKAISHIVGGARRDFKEWLPKMPSDEAEAAKKAISLLGKYLDKFGE
jgi:hypothetical protein